MVKRMAVLVAGALCAVLLAGTPAAARTVGLLFDDSGSMEGRFQTALMAARLLAASLDPAQDKLFYVTTSDYRQLRQADLSKPGKFSPSFKADGGTPVEALESLMTQLSRVSGQDSDLALVVLTDGDFNGAPDPARIKEWSNHLQAKRRNAWFIAVDADKVVTKQRIKDALLQGINGSVDDWYENVVDASTLFSSMGKVSMALSDGQDALGGIAAIRGDTITFTSPLPVDQVTLIFQDEKSKRLPEFRGSSLDPAIIRSKQGAVVEMDKDDKVNTTPQAAHVLTLRMAEALAADTPHSLHFTRPLDAARTRVLLRTTVQIGWKIVSAAGVPLTPDSNGRYHVVAGRDYTVQAEMYVDGKSRTKADLAALEKQGLRLTLHDGSGSGARPMRIDPSRNVAEAPFSFSNPGNFQATVVGVLAGLLHKSSANINVAVSNPNVSVAWDCPNCTGGKVAAEVGDGIAAAFDVTARVNAPQSGKYALSVTGLPLGVTVRGPGSTTLNAGNPTAMVKLSPGEALPLAVAVGPDARSRIGENVRLTFSLAAQAPLGGDGVWPVEMSIEQGKVRLKVVGHDLPDRTQPFSMVKTDLGRHGIVVQVEGLSSPIAPGTVTGGGDFRAHIFPQGNDTVLVVPQPPLGNLCAACLISEGQHQLDIRYDDGLRRGTVSAPVLLTSPGWLAVLRTCLPTVLGLLLLLYLLVVLVRLYLIHTTRRFPPASRVTMTPRPVGGATERPTMRRLRQNNRIYLGALNPFRALPFEISRIHTMLIRVRRYGSLELLPDTSSKSLALDGELVLQRFAENGRRPIPVVYGAILSDHEFREIVFERA